MNKICVYTCITGDYDNLKDLVFPDKDFDYICFTNNRNITSNFWKVIYIQDDKLDNLTLARKIKILGHEELKKYDLTIWLDGAMQLRKPLSTFMNECCDLDSYDMVGFKHRDRDCIYDEIDTCVYLFKENIENAKKIYDFLKKENYPEHNGLIESTVLVRKNNDDVKKLMNLWFDMLSKYSRRDQLSFNYCLWKNPINIQMLEMNVFDNDYFIHEGHKSIFFSRNYRVYFGDNYKFDNLFEEKYKYEKGCYEASFNVPFDVDKIELIVSPYDYVILNDVETNIKYDFNCYLLSDYKVFFKNRSLVFYGNFKKNENIKIKFNFDVLNIDVVFNILERSNSMYERKISDLENNLTSTTEELNKVLNSKGWKMLENLRKLKR